MPRVFQQEWHPFTCFYDGYTLKVVGYMSADCRMSGPCVKYPCYIQSRIAFVDHVKSSADSLNFHPFKVVFHYRDPQHQVGANHSYLRSEIFGYIE